MSEEVKTKNWKVMPGLGYLLFFGAGLFLFFISAFLVVLIRTKSSSKLIMPDVVGQNYTDVHNELSRLRLKVKIDTKRFPDKNDGEILYQSISPGKKLETGSKVYLTVNSAVDRIIIPDLKGQQLNSAKALMEKVISGDSYVKMELGGVTYVPGVEGQAPETVLDQIPQPGKITNTKEKIYLLVTEPKTGDDSSMNFEGMPFPLVSFALNQKKIAFKISEFLTSSNPKQNGIIQESVKSSDGYSFKVNFFEFDEKPFQSFEKISLKVSNSGEYNAKLMSTTEEGVSTNLFTNLKIQAGEEFKFMIYRKGNVRFDLLAANGDKEKSIKFESDFVR